MLCYSSDMTEMYPERGPHEPPDLNNMEFSITPEEELALRLDGLKTRRMFAYIKSEKSGDQLFHLPSKDIEAINQVLDATTEFTKITEILQCAEIMEDEGIPKATINRFINKRFQEE